MELSLPYLALRKVPSSAASDHHTAKNIRCRADISFLNLSGSTTGRGVSCWTIQEAITSFTIRGVDEHHWTGYAFSDGTPFNDEESDDEFSDEEDDLESMPREDMFATVDSDHVRLISDDMDWDPRKYFLCCLELRIDTACREWTYLIRCLESGSMTWVSDSDTPHRDIH
jgi:hypothetical protein